MTERASDGWERELERHGVTFTALIEALGRQLAAGDDSALTPEVIREARHIDRQRYSRRGRGAEPDEA